MGCTEVAQPGRRTGSIRRYCGGANHPLVIAESVRANRIRALYQGQRNLLPLAPGKPWGRKFKSSPLYHFWGANLNSLERYKLLQYCRKYGLDSQEIDSTLTYWENKKHLRSLTHMLSQSLDTFEMARMEELQKQYIAEHALTYYASYRMGEKTKSRSVEYVDTRPQRFSLKTMAEVAFSLRQFVQTIKVK